MASEAAFRAVEVELNPEAESSPAPQEPNAGPEIDGAETDTHDEPSKELR